MSLLKGTPTCSAMRVINPHCYIPYRRISNVTQLFSNNNNKIHKVVIYHGVENVQLSKGRRQCAVIYDKHCVRQDLMDVPKNRVLDTIGLDTFYNTMVFTYHSSPQLLSSKLFWDISFPLVSRCKIYPNVSIGISKLELRI